MWLIILLLSYLLGSIPFGLIVTYLVKGEDIRRCGSGNIGATNVSRLLGKQWGMVVFFLDVLKGYLPLVFVSLSFTYNNLWFYLSMGLAAVLGHTNSIFLKFKGGKGVATSVGVILGLCGIYPSLIMPLFLAGFIWIVSFYISRYVSLASLLAVSVFFLLSLFVLTKELKLFSAILFILVLIRHKSNLKKLIKGEELSFKGTKDKKE